MWPKRNLNARARSALESRAKASPSPEARGIAGHGEREIAEQTSAARSPSVIDNERTEPSQISGVLNSRKF
jgi:hypothetical protein